MANTARCCQLDLRQMAKALQVISEPNRLKTICLLKQGERCVCELEAALQIKHNLVCHHLKELSRLGLLQAKTRGNFTFYRLDKKNYQALLTGVIKVLGVS